MKFGESLLLSIACGVMCFVGARPAAADTDASACETITVTVTADVTKLSSNTNQQKLRTDLSDSFAQVAIPDQSDSMTDIGWRLSQAAPDWHITDKGKLGEYLGDAMRAACKTLTNGQKNNTEDDAYKAALAAARLPGNSRSQFHLYAGSVNSLQAQGGFTSNVEADFISRTTLSGAHQPVWADRNTHSLDGVFELNYAKIGAVASSNSGSNSNSSGSSTPSAAQNSSVNPFTASSGILRVNGSVEWARWCDDYLGIAGGVGATSRTNSSASSADLSPRAFAGLLFLANYGSAGNVDATTGRILLGYAYDDFWKTGTSTGSTSIPSQPNRVFLDGRIDFPGVFKSQQVKFSFQVYADAPAASHGPADVRFSLLVSVDLQSLFGGAS